MFCLAYKTIEEKEDSTHLLISEWINIIIRLLFLVGEVTTLTEKGFRAEIGFGSKPEHLIFHYPEGLIFDPDYQLLYVCELVSCEK